MQQQLSNENFNQMLSRFSTNELEGLVDKFPYFQQAHVLLAKKYQQENHPKFDEQLQLAALYTQDRDFLFSIFQEIKPENLLEIPLPSTLRAEELNEQMIAQEKPESSAQELVTEIVDEKPLEPGPIVEILEEEVADQIRQDVISIPSEEVASGNEIVTETEEIFLATEPHTFDEWLSAFNRPADVGISLSAEPSLPAPELPTPPPDKQDEELEQLILSNLPLQELVEEETHYSKGLDKFIEEQKLKHKPQEIRMPVYENDLAPELITETIAKIYEMQKKYARAIRAYEILALKYPEKNDFFAARINNLKNIT